MLAQIYSEQKKGENVAFQMEKLISLKHKLDRMKDQVGERMKNICYTTFLLLTFDDSLHLRYVIGKLCWS